LVGGLADENKRWGENVETYKKERITMIGNALLSAAFVSYIGPFSSVFRNKLWSGTWLPDIEARKIPFTSGVDPLKVLATDSD
jgi:dynein heavy chain